MPSQRTYPNCRPRLFAVLLIASLTYGGGFVSCAKSSPAGPSVPILTGNIKIVEVYRYSNDDMAFHFRDEAGVELIIFYVGDVLSPSRGKRGGLYLVKSVDPPMLSDDILIPKQSQASAKIAGIVKRALEPYKLKGSYQGQLPRLQKKYGDDFGEDLYRVWIIQNMLR